MLNTNGNSNVKVLVVDDSAVVRKILSRELNKKDGIEVIATAPDPYIARDKIVALKPDVLTLDIEMPKMDGITFLRKLMAARPMPVIVLSSLAEEGGPVALEALEAGAFEVVKKPGAAYSVEESCDELDKMIKAAARSKPTKIVSAPVKKPQPTLAMTKTTQKIIAIGSSTGGVQSLTKVFTALPALTPGIVVVQHMPPHFTKLFAGRLNEQCEMNVKEAAEGDSVLTGQILIAPGGSHMKLNRSGANYFVTLDKGPQVCHQRPSVEVLFDSVAQYAGSNAVGAILTGMGNDGAQGLLKMRQSGARTLAQDEKSCIVFGMPKEAIKAGGAEHVVPLDDVAAKLLQLVQS